MNVNSSFFIAQMSESSFYFWMFRFRHIIIFEISHFFCLHWLLSFMPFINFSINIFSEFFLKYVYVLFMWFQFQLSKFGSLLVIWVVQSSRTNHFVINNFLVFWKLFLFFNYDFTRYEIRMDKNWMINLRTLKEDLPFETILKIVVYSFYYCKISAYYFWSISSGSFWFFDFLFIYFLLVLLIFHISSFWFFHRFHFTVNFNH